MTATMPARTDVGDRQTRLAAIAKAGIRALLQLAGDDPDRPGLAATPDRVVRAFLEMTDRPGDPAALLARQFTDAGPVDQPVTVGPIAFTSVCEHHLLAFPGTAWVSYLPGASGTVIGLSKLPRVVQHYARRPQIQERLTTQIADAIMTHTDAAGAACLIRADHTCMTLRGVRQPGAQMTTTALRGTFAGSAVLRAEFLAQARG